jgi:hypothetical protein
MRSSEAEFLRAAGVQHVLVDPTDLAHGSGFEHVVLDSGAYRCFKRGTPLDAAAYQALARRAKIDWPLAPGEMGDAAATEHNWDEFRQPSMVPVWGFGSDRRLLHKYHDVAERVAIGGLVTRMREKDEAMLKVLTALCEEFPRTFHILGGNWLSAACHLKDLAHSLDSVEWLVGVATASWFSSTREVASCSARLLASSASGTCPGPSAILNVRARSIRFSTVQRKRPGPQPHQCHGQA